MSKSTTVKNLDDSEDVYTGYDEVRVYERTAVITWFFHPSGRRQKEVIIPLECVIWIAIDYGDQP